MSSQLEAQLAGVVVARQNVLRQQRCAKDLEALLGAAPQAVQLSESRNQRVYVAGPMTGMPDYNFPAFNAAASMLRAKGWHVENPAEHGIVAGATWADYMHYDLARLATCSAIYLLPGWCQSRGAALEVHIASALGMTFQYADGAERYHPPSATHPTQQGLAVISGAIALCKHAAKIQNIDFDDYWKIHSDEFKEEAQLVLVAAQAKQGEQANG